MSNLPVELSTLIDSYTVQYRDDLIENFRNDYGWQEVAESILDCYVDESEDLIDMAEEFKKEAKAYCGEVAKQLQAEYRKQVAAHKRAVKSAVSEAQKLWKAKAKAEGLDPEEFLEAVREYLYNH